MPQKDKDGIIQFDASLVKKLQLDLVAARQQRSEVIENSRLYWQRVQAVHEAILLLLDAKGLHDAVTLLQEEVARLLGFDTICFFYERLPDDGIGGATTCFRTLPAFMAQATYGATEFYILEDRAQLETLLPEQSALMAFAIYLPIKTGKRRGAVILASRDAQPASVTHALEPYVFLARSVERLGSKWLE